MEMGPSENEAEVERPRRVTTGAVMEAAVTTKLKLVVFVRPPEAVPVIVIG